MAFFGPSPSATDIGNAVLAAIGNNETASAIATAIQAASGSNATATDIGTEILNAIGANPSASDIGNAVASGAIRLKPLVRYLDENGDGTGNFSANVDGSSTPVEFFIQPPASTFMRIAEISVFLQDSGMINSEDYGGLAALTTGIDIEVVLNSTTFSLTGQKKIQGHSDYGTHFDSIDFLPFDATGSVEKTLVSRKGGIGINLDGDNNDKLIVRINDNMTALTEHFFVVQGFEV